MSSGPLLHLISSDHGGICSTFPSLANSSSYTVQELTGASHYTVDHHGADVVEPIAVGITGPDQHIDDALILTIGGSVVTRVPLSLLFLSGHTSSAENIHRFDIGPFFPPIEVVRLSYHVVGFSLESGAQFTLCLRKTCLPHTKRQHLAQTHERTSIIQQVATHTFDDISTVYTKYIPFTGFTKGYIVEAPDISQLTRFRLQIGTNTNMYDLINYSPALLAVAAHRLSPHHMWIPIDSTQSAASLFSRTEESFVNGLNHSGINNTTFTLEFTATQPASSVHIHSILINKFRSCYGMGGNYYANELTPLPHAAAPEAVASPNLFNMEAVIDAPLPPDRTMCPITHDTLESSDQYGRCATCNQCIEITALHSTFTLQTSAAKNCPMCRSEWTDYTVYRVP